MLKESPLEATNCFHNSRKTMRGLLQNKQFVVKKLLCTIGMVNEVKSTWCLEACMAKCDCSILTCRTDDPSPSPFAVTSIHRSTSSACPRPIPARRQIKALDFSKLKQTLSIRRRVRRFRRRTFRKTRALRRPTNKLGRVIRPQ